MSACMKCHRENNYINGPHICLSCSAKEADISRQSLHLQEELLSIESQRLFEQRQFQQKILEQSISKEKAFETGQKQDFYDGSITLYGDFYGLNISSPYLSEDLTAAFFAGAFSKLEKLIGPYDDKHISEMTQRIMDVASDLNKLILGKGADLVNRHLEDSELPYSYAEEFERNYRLLSKGSDGKNYCVHIAQFKLKMYVGMDGRFTVEGISPKQFCQNEKAASIFDAALGFPQFVDQVNDKPDQVIRLRKILEKKYRKVLRNARNHRWSEAFSMAIGRIIVWGFLGGAIGLVPSLIMSSWGSIIWLSAIFGVMGLLSMWS